MTKEELRKLNDGNRESYKKSLRQEFINEFFSALFLGVLSYSIVYFIFLQIPLNMYMTESLRNEHSIAAIFWMWTFWYPFTRLSTIFAVPVMLCFVYPLYAVFMFAYHNH